MTSSKQENSEDINVLELRNYLLKPNSADTFCHFFHSRFVSPMNDLGGRTLGEFKIDGVNDRFVWLRGFTDMKTRVKFLNDFYISSAAWKEYGKGANEMMINSDNVYLLKPLHKNGMLKAEKAFTLVDFYICNNTRDKVIRLFDTEYIPFLKTINVQDISFWVSEMTENDFPKLPVFQDKNLLVAISNFPNKEEYEAKQNAIVNMPPMLKLSMQELITTHNSLLLSNQSIKRVTMQDTLAIPEINFDTNGDLIITPSATSSKHDFDFLEGKWNIHNQKLKTRLNHCTDWTEFESPSAMHRVLSGIGNIDNFLATFNGQPFEGMTVRLFNPKTRLWSIYWADSNEGKFDPPVVGSFENNVGYFFTKDSFNGENILVAFRWDARDKDNPIWSQAFSDNKGETWEWNWYMLMTKIIQ